MSLPAFRPTTGARAIALALLLWGGGIGLTLPDRVQSQTATTPFVRPAKPTELAPRIYEQMPDLPRANSYRSVATGEARPNDTFISRLIQYHVQIKARRLGSRMDWKLTFADLLGVNGPVFPEQYVGFEILTPNPTVEDLKLVEGLTRRQRLQLVDLLAALQPPPPEAAPKPTPKPAPAEPEIPVPTVRPSTPTPPSTPVKGQGANLLKF
jgi:hypothetical protein